MLQSPVLKAGLILSIVNGIPLKKTNQVDERDILMGSAEGNALVGGRRATFLCRPRLKETVASHFYSSDG